MVGITIFIHYNNHFNLDAYDWNIYVNQPHLRPGGRKASTQMRFGNHYIGSELGLQAAKNQSMKGMVALFFKILIGDVQGEPELPGWPK
jgi:hypothetical protein